MERGERKDRYKRERIRWKKEREREREWRV